MHRTQIAMLCASVVMTLLLSRAAAQTPENIQMPEYYGIYGLIDGKLCGITVPTQDCSVKTTDVRIGNNNVRAIEYRKGTRFLIYQENPSMFAAALSLRPMFYVRNITSSSLMVNMQNQSKTEAAGFWQLVNPSQDLTSAIDGSLREQVQPIQFLVKPFKANSVIVVAARELTPGLYHFTGKDLTASSELYFWVGSAAEGEADKCVDQLRVAAAMGIVVENRYKSCSEEMKAAQKVISESGSSGNASVSSTTAELVDISKKLDDAQIRGDKAMIESYLTDDFIYRDTGNRKTMDRAKFLAKIKPDKSIKSLNCYDYKLSFEGDQAILSGLCEYDIKQILSLHVKERFTDRFVKRDGNWKLAVAETIVLPNR